MNQCLKHLCDYSNFFICNESMSKTFQVIGGNSFFFFLEVIVLSLSQQSLQIFKLRTYPHTKTLTNHDSGG
jgi:hypothetical protein